MNFQLAIKQTPITEKKNTSDIWWSASNNSSFLNNRRTAKTLRSAVRDSRRYVDNELYGDGVVSFYNGKDDTTPFRIDAKSIFTKYRWSINNHPD